MSDAVGIGNPVRYVLPLRPGTRNGGQVRAAFVTGLGAGGLVNLQVLLDGEEDVPAGRQSVVWVGRVPRGAADQPGTWHTAEDEEGHDVQTEIDQAASGAGTSFSGYGLLELFGHRKLAGYITQEKHFGADLLRIDIPLAEGGSLTQWYGGSAIYGLTPTDEATAKRVALHHRPEPVHPWELRSTGPEQPRQVLTEGASSYWVHDPGVDEDVEGEDHLPDNPEDMVAVPGGLSGVLSPVPGDP